MHAVRLVLLAIVLAACGVPAGAAMRERARVAMTRDTASGPVAARRIVVTHQHVPTGTARLVEMRWSIDGEELGRERWEEAAPELDRALFTGQVPAGDHAITIEARYRLYTCCYACGWTMGLTFRTVHRVHIDADERICFRTGPRVRLTDPVETFLAARPFDCD